MTEEHGAWDARNFPTITVNQMEYEALRNVDRVLRICMVNPHVGEILSVAIQALDAVRRDQGIDAGDVEMLKSEHAAQQAAAQQHAEQQVVRDKRYVTEASDLTKSLIQRAKR